MVWLWFAISLVIILVAGTKAAGYADVIASRTGLGRVWIGLLFLAMMTSMPELVTSVSSAVLVGDEGVPDLGLGTLLGSCIFNLSILALLDVLSRRVPVLNRASRRQVMAAAGAVVLIAVVGGTILGGGGWSTLALGWVGVATMVVFALYLVGAWGLFRQERNHRVLPDPLSASDAGSLRSILLKFAVAALGVIGGGIWVSFIGDEIAAVTGWDTSFVGSLFLAITTSMPELVVAITAFRLGATDLAVADVLGANMLDISYVLVVDLFYTKGPLLSLVSDAHVITSAIIAAMSLIIIIGLRFRESRKTFFVISWYAVLLFGLYFTGAYLLFTFGIGA